MVGVRKKKYESGEGAQYMSRKQALLYLQLSLKYFRKLCILKGIYPREPKNRKRAQKGKTNIQTLYSKKDIQFLSHEPLIWKLRDLKVFSKKMSRAKSLRDLQEMRRQLNKHPTLTLDHIIKERYPSFTDALRDMDDCLSLCFLFSTFPSLKHVPRDQSALCRRLTIEFLHACIHAKALRKVFISIKGYYFQVEINGQLVTWIMPHKFSFRPLSTEEVDFRIMATFVELYTVLLGFVNYQLYQNLNLMYPPRLAGYNGDARALTDETFFVSERIAALNQPLVGTAAAAPEEADMDQFPVSTEDDPEGEEKRQEILRVQKQKTLFSGLKVFLNREVPREPLVFVLRCLGATVSWDALLYAGATFPENDESITHQICDRPSMETQYLSRYYVQPQWVFDSVNACEILPVDKYLLGAILPPHLSPFVAGERSRVYQPPEETPDIPRYQPEPEEEKEEEKLEDEDDEGHESEEEKEEEDANDKLKGMKVTAGTVKVADPWEAKKARQQERHLREKMVSRKHQRLFKSMVGTRRAEAKEIWLLRKKRRLHEQKEKTADATA